MIVISRAQPPGLRPGQYTRTPADRYLPASATPSRSSNDHAMRTNLIKVESVVR